MGFLTGAAPLSQVTQKAAHLRRFWCRPKPAQRAKQPALSRRAPCRPSDGKRAIAWTLHPTTTGVDG
ncbi:hypothetical protein [Spirosoma daeguense]